LTCLKHRLCLLNISVIIMNAVSYHFKNLNHDVVSVDTLLDILKLWVQLRYPIYPYILLPKILSVFFHKTFGSILKVAWIMSFLHCVHTGSLFTSGGNRRITTEKTCYVGSNMHLCLEFYVDIVRYIVVIFYGPL
jgi:hypothetical protein